MSPQSENAHPSCSSEPREFSLEERKVLLNLAHEAIQSALEAREVPLIPPSPHLAEAVEIGKHGLLISMAGHRGLLLPQVPAEHGWDRITFLEQTCKKAGLPLNGWQTGAKLEAFTAEVFGDRDQPCL